MIQQLEDQKKKQTELQPYIKIEAQIDLLYYLIEEKNLKLKNKKYEQTNQLAFERKIQ